MRFNLPETIEGSSFSERSQSFLHNYYNIDGRLLPRERMRMLAAYNVTGNTGIDSLSDKLAFRNRRPRALMKSADGNTLYSLIGDKLYKLHQNTSTDPENQISFDEDDYSFTTYLGDIGSAINLRRTFAGPNQKVSWAAGFTGIAVTTGTSQFFIGTDDSITTLFTSSPAFTAATAVAHVDGRYLWLDHTNRLVYFSEVNDAGNVGGNSFFDSETVTDPSNEMIVIGNELYIFGTRSIERFRATGSSTAPFQRVTNSVINIGLVGGLIKRQDSAVFIGREAHGATGVYMLQGGRTIKISNNAVDEVLNTGISYGIEPQSIKSCEACSFSSYGRSVYVFNLVSYESLSNGGTTYDDVPTRALSLYCMDSPQGYKWGFLANRDEDFEDGRYADVDQADIISQWDVLGHHYFEYTEPVFYKDHWLFLRSPLPKKVGSTVSSAEDSIGLYVMGNHRLDNNRLQVANHDSGGTTEAIESLNALKYEDLRYTLSGSTKTFTREPISRGFRMFFQDENEKQIELKSVEVVFSKQWALDDDGDNADSGDTLNLKVSGNEGAQGWSANDARPFGSLGNRGKLQFNKVGGIASADGHIGAVIETKSDKMLVIEKVLVNV